MNTPTKMFTLKFPQAILIFTRTFCKVKNIVGSSGVSGMLLFVGKVSTAYSVSWNTWFKEDLLEKVFTVTW